MASAVQKIIVVGEPQTGKTSIISSFLEYDGALSQSVIGGVAQQKKKKIILNENADFTLKIIRINGEKVRLQLWDQGLSKDTQSTFQPLFTRHSAGCIVVANSDNLQSIKKAHQWKKGFDQST